MDFALTDEQKMVQDMARNFAEKEIAPFVEEDEDNHFYRREILTKMGELGLLGWEHPGRIRRERNGLDGSGHRIIRDRQGTYIVETVDQRKLLGDRR